MANGNQGPAERGSRRCLQHDVNVRPDHLREIVLSASPGLMSLGVSQFDWVSPLASENYFEYRDDFLTTLGLESHEAALRRFWPLNGPQWDSLAKLSVRCGQAVLLVEAKAHPGESMTSCQATDPASIATIQRAFSRVQGFMGIAPSEGVVRYWMEGGYQLANRIAFLYFLNELARVPTYLSLINYVNDRSNRPTSLKQWRVQYEQHFSRLGLLPGGPLIDKIEIVYPEAPAFDQCSTTATTGTPSE